MNCKSCGKEVIYSEFIGCEDSNLCSKCNDEQILSKWHNCDHLAEEVENNIDKAKPITDPEILKQVDEIMIGYKSGAKKYDTGKAKLSLNPPEALEMMAEAFAYGLDKYKEKNNYRKGLEWSRLIDAALRHIHAFSKGEDIDESGLNHISHSLACLAMLAYNIKCKPELDDR